MLSRVAESIYWMSRYIERAEHVARFHDVSEQLALDLPRELADPWAALIATTGDDELFRERHGKPTHESVVRFLAFDRGYDGSIVSCLAKARENARSVREIISSEMWELINTAYLRAREASPDDLIDSPHAYLGEVKRASHLFVGTTYLTMTHNESWHFARLGRLLERADKTSRIVDVHCFLLLDEARDVAAPSTHEELAWTALLRSASALEMYRKAHGPIDPSDVVDFLVLERRFPRSLRYCLSKADRSLHAITGTPLGSRDSRAERDLGALTGDFEFATVRDLLEGGLHAYLDSFQTKLNDVGTGIWETFFALTPLDEPSWQEAQQQLSWFATCTATYLTLR